MVKQVIIVDVMDGTEIRVDSMDIPDLGDPFELPRNKELNFRGRKQDGEKIHL